MRHISSSPKISQPVSQTPPHQTSAEWWRSHDDSRVARMVRNNTAGGPDEVVNAVVAYLKANGGCVWHAASVVTKRACHCAECRPKGKYK